MDRVHDRIGAITRLCQLKNIELSEDTLRLWVEDLADVPADALSAACARIAHALTANVEPAIIRATADQVLREAWADTQQKALPPAQGDAGKPHVNCPACQDDPSAWIYSWCRGSLRDAKQVVAHESLRLPEHRCERLKEHVPHTHVRRCECWNEPWRQAQRAPRPVTQEVPRGKRRNGEWR